MADSQFPAVTIQLLRVAALGSQVAERARQCLTNHIPALAQGKESGLRRSSTACFWNYDYYYKCIMRISMWNLMQRSSCLDYDAEIFILPVLQV